jgi:hypothetical protein
MGKYRFIVVIVLWLSNHSFLFAAQISMEFVFGNTGKEGAIVLDKLPSYTENEQFGFEFGSEHNVGMGLLGRKNNYTKLGRGEERRYLARPVGAVAEDIVSFYHEVSAFNIAYAKT